MIACDIDGCLFDNFHRRHLVPNDKSRAENWSAFNKACSSDQPVLPVIDFVKHHAKTSGCEIYFITSRGEDSRKETAAQLFNHFGDFKCRLLMRPMTDGRDVVTYKKAALHSIGADFSEHSLIIDDHPGVIKMASIFFPNINRLLVKSYDCTLVGEL